MDINQRHMKDETYLEQIWKISQIQMKKLSKNTKVNVGLTVLDFDREHSGNYGTVVLANISNIGEVSKFISSPGKDSQSLKFLTS